MLGPVDYVVVGFPGNNFDGSIVDELKKASQSGVIRVIDLLFVIKDSDGTAIVGEYSDQPAEVREAFDGLGFDDEMPLFTEGDINDVGALLENDTTAAILVIEQLWAKGLKKALIDADGVLIDEGRLHPEAVAEALEDLAAEAFED